MPAFRLLVVAILLVLLPVAVVAQWGIAPDGTKGRMHTVVQGDTLWDITETYLGTPWIWPSVWKENEIENPHLISPGEVIWITDRGMRKLTPEEIGQIRPLPDGEETGPANADDDSDDSDDSDDELRLDNADTSKDTHDPFASLDGNGADVERMIRFPGLHRFGFITPKELSGAGAVLGSHDHNYWTSQERRTIVSLGEGQVHVGDRYTIFRMRRRVRHPETAQDLGVFVQHLGTAEITEIHPESSYVKVLASYGEIEPGDRLLPFEELPTQFAVTPTELAYNGMIVAKQPYRLYAGESDLVLIDRGSFDGVTVGNELEIYRSGREVNDPVSNSKTLVPDDILGKMFVLKVGPNTSMALIRNSKMEIRVGDHFRSL
jgi:hypothetical protein